MAEHPQENKLDHPCFPQPTDSSVRVWRYLDLAKFIWLLENQKLYLASVDSLNDPYEGSTPKSQAALTDQQMLGVHRYQLTREFGDDLGSKKFKRKCLGSLSRIAKCASTIKKNAGCCTSIVGTLET